MPVRHKTSQKLFTYWNLFSLCFGLSFLVNSCTVTSSSSNAPATLFPYESIDSTPTAAAVLLLPTTTPTLTTTAPLTDELLFGCIPANTLRQEGTVIRIIDGDTIHVEIAGQDYSVRYIGIDAPEVGEEGADAATDYNSQLVIGKKITLIQDVSNTDKYDRLLRYVVVGDLFVNEELVAKGVAVAGKWEPDTACYNTFKATQNQAKVRFLGLWQTPTVIAAASSPTALAGSSQCPNGCTEHIAGCDIKGNINNSGEKIYHLPGQQYYDKTIITPGKGERWFCNEAEAIANGWRKSKV